MISQTAVVSTAEAPGSSASDLAATSGPDSFRYWFYRPGADCSRVCWKWARLYVRKHMLDPDRLYKMSRHFVWLIPVSNVCVFLTLGVAWVWHRSLLAAPRPLAGQALPVRALLLPVHSGGFSPDLWSGMAGCGAGGGHAAGSAHRTPWSRFSAIRPLQLPGSRRDRGDPGWIDLVGRPIPATRESARPLPPPGSPNVLLIVMDTVAAGHLGLHGYNRATSTTLTELAERGIRFDSARAASSWTLPSHATMFTGRWLHELSVGWLTPLDQKHPTLAEFLGDRGYATAGFVANTFYCGSSSGLARGFTHYHDFILSRAHRT